MENVSGLVPPAVDSLWWFTRRRVSVQRTLLLALMPTATILLGVILLEAFSKQRLLFASLSSSAFLIYRDPQHWKNRLRTLVLSQLLAVGIGFGWCSVLGPGYGAAALSMFVVIGILVVFDALHPPAVSTALSFSFKGGDKNSLLLFGLAVGLLALLLALQCTSKWMLAQLTPVEVSHIKPIPVVARSQEPGDSLYPHPVPVHLCQGATQT